MKFGQGQFFEDSLFPSMDDVGKFLDSGETQIKLGLPQWRIPEWKGNFYAPATPVVDFLSDYSKLLDCVEVSSTFYAPVGPDKISNWSSQTENNFHFLPKWPRLITHDALLKTQKSMIFRFIENMEAFEEKLGATLLQLPPHFSREYNRELFQFLESIPKNFPVCIEFRHNSWFEKGRLIPKLEEYLVKNNRGMVCSDTPGASSTLHKSITSNKHIIRYLSDEHLEHDQFRLARWRDCLNQKLGEATIYFVIHRPDNDLAPNLLPLFDNKFKARHENYSQGPQQQMF